MGTGCGPGVTSGGGTCLSWSCFAGGCWALLKAELLIPFSGSSEVFCPSLLHPWVRHWERFPLQKLSQVCACGTQGQPDLEEAKVLQDKPWGHCCCPPLSYLCASSLPSWGQISLLISDKTHPAGGECVTFPGSRGGLGPFCFLGHFILQ